MLRRLVIQRNVVATWEPGTVDETADPLDVGGALYPRNVLGEEGEDWSIEDGGPVEDVAALLAARLDAAAAAYETERTKPFAWDFGTLAALYDDGSAAGAAGEQTLQMRDEPDHPDQANWTKLLTGVTLALMGGGGALVFPMKTSANVWVQTTAADVAKVLAQGDGVKVSALQRGQTQLQRFGLIKQELRALADADDAEGLRAYDVAAGYPA